MTKLLLFTVALFCAQFTFAQKAPNLVDDAYVMTNIKSFFSTGQVRCDVICYVKPADKKQDNMLIEIRTADGDSILFESLVCLDGEGSTEKNGLFEIPMGEIVLEQGFDARLLIDGELFVEVIDLDLVTFSGERK